jgi:outer membrane protein assembly factor BamD (BamD/ComL family)
MKIKDNTLIITLLFVVFGTTLVQCSNQPTRDELYQRAQQLETELKERAEQAESPDDQPMLQTARELAQTQHKFGITFKSDSLAPEYLFKASMIYSEMLGEPQQAIDLLNTLQRRYPDHDRAEKSLFLVGFTYAEKMKDFDRAKLAYTKFLERYPESELATSVQFELKYLNTENPNQALEQQLDSLLQKQQ